MSTKVESACRDDSLDRVDNDTIVMRSGAVYRALDDPDGVAFWMPLSPVTICDKVDRVSDGIVTYYEVRNKDENQIVRAIRVK
jgi:hypothetical protein